MKFILIIVFFICQHSFSQTSILLIGNSDKLCYKDYFSMISDTLPKDLSQFNAIYIFSNSTSQLDKNDIERIIAFVENGGGLYSGSENWPLQAESKQITRELYKKESYGEYDKTTANTSTQDGNLQLNSISKIPSGESTVAFPLDYRLTVEAWIDDQPFILSGNYGKGRIIIDGGYSRFYCEHRTEVCDEIFRRFRNYLITD